MIYVDPNFFQVYITIQLFSAVLNYILTSPIVYLA